MHDDDANTKFESEAGVEEKDSPEIKFGKLKAHLVARP